MASPTSPLDEPMADLNILDRSVQEMNRPQKIITNDQGQGLVKATDTLRNNIDLKNETNKKRTSLNIENGCKDADGDSDLEGTSLTSDIVEKTKHLSKRSSRALDNAIHGNNNNRCDDSSASSSGDEKLIKNCAALSDVDNRKVRRVRTRVDNGNNGMEDDDDDYNDMENGNTTDSSHKRDSMTSKESSSDDYFLCEKFKNSLNSQFTDIVQAEIDAAGEPMELLSPQEVELGRRYAEISQFKNNKW